MNGLPLGDAVIWAVLGLIVGAVSARWASVRVPLIMALGVAVIGFVLVPLAFILLGAVGTSYAVMIVLWSVPTTLGLALGAALSRLWPQD